MSKRTVGRSALAVILCACAPQREPQVARSEPPPVVVDVGDSKGGSGELVPDGQKRKEPAPAAADEARKRELDRKIAENAGILGLLQADGALESPFGSSALGNDALTAKGGLLGDPIGEAYGTGGLGLSGTGRGGGGTGEGTIGLGKVGVIGRGGGGTGSGYGSGVGRLGSSRRGQPAKVTPGRSMVVGKLDKGIIRRIIRRHVNQIRYCYERELAKEPNLAGRLSLKFTIGPDGKVTTVNVAQPMHGGVDSCVTRVFRRMMFPKPEGGGIVVVSYPFVFQPSSPASAAPKKLTPVAPPPKPAPPKVPANQPKTK
ncbi:MAG: AgmX/PglI C-terminal domain-containing protein [Deltaproteobacteria bacterium]|jgi:hypothetical protein|nr:AgmX/PglI C-terminal domain-containing protein [Deltaproteobacteria bacterium]MBW2536964.1 AgmX/PglI C-terminal domain-containing protein [Deltaproteobacteria bacterium]